MALRKEPATSQAAISFQELLETLGDAWGLSCSLDFESINRFHLVSRFFHQFASRPYDWRLRLARDFGFKMTTLTQFEETAQLLGITINHQHIYKHLRQFAIGAKKQRLIKQRFSHALDSHFLLLAVCANAVDPALIAYYIPNDEKDFWRNVAVIAGCHRVMRHTESDGQIDYQLSLAALSGDLAMLQFLMEPMNGFNFRLGSCAILYFAAQSGNLVMLQCLINDFKQRPDQGTLECAALSGNMDMLLYLLDPTNGFGLTPNGNTVRSAVMLGNLVMLQFLLNFVKVSDFCYDTIHAAARFGRLVVLKYLINRCGLRPSQETLNGAAQSSNPRVWEYLMDPENGFDLHPNKVTLDQVAQFGQLSMLKYLLDPVNGFNLRPDQATLNEAAAGNLAMLKFLLDPANGFYLRPDQATLHMALASGSSVIPLFLLDPANGFNLAPIAYALNVAVCYDENLRFAIRDYFAAEQSSESLNRLLESAQLSLRHFFRLCVHACFHPEYLQLNNTHRLGLTLAMRSAAEKIPYVPIERETIIPLLEKAYHAMRQAKQTDIADALSDIMDIFEKSEPRVARAERFVRSPT